MAGDGLDEGGLSRTRHAIEEIGPASLRSQQAKCLRMRNRCLPSVGNARLLIEGPHILPHKVCQVVHGLRLGLLGQNDGLERAGLCFARLLPVSTARVEIKDSDDAFFGLLQFFDQL